MKHAWKLVAVAGVLALFAANAAVADTTAQVTSLTLSSVTGGVKASGKATFGADPIEALTDATGDGRLPGSDITSATVTPVSAKTTNFSVHIATPLPTGSLPGVTHWFWSFNVDGQEQVLAAMNTNAVAGAAGEWYFALQSCVPDPNTGQGSCTDSDAEGTYADGVITWSIPNASIGLASGGVITDGTVYNTVGAAGAVWAASGPGVIDTASHGEVEVPGARIELALLDAAGTVVSTASPKPTSSGSFTTTLPGSGATVTARACFGVVCGDVVSAAV